MTNATKRDSDRYVINQRTLDAQVLLIEDIFSRKENGSSRCGEGMSREGVEGREQAVDEVVRCCGGEDRH